MKHRNPAVPVGVTTEPMRKTSSMGPPDFQGKRSPAQPKPPERAWGNGSYDVKTGRACGVEERSCNSMQMPRTGKRTGDC